MLHRDPVRLECILDVLTLPLQTDMGKSPNKNLTPNLVAIFKGKNKEPILVHLHFDVKAAYS